jgi:hypothetical protein
MGIRMLTLVTKTSLYVEDRGLQVPIFFKWILNTDFFQVAIKTHSFEDFENLEIFRLVGLKS